MRIAMFLSMVSNQQKIMCLSMQINRLRRRSKFNLKMGVFHYLRWRRQCANKKSRKWSRVRISKFWEEDVPKLSEEEFKNCFRVGRSTFNGLAENLQMMMKSDTNWRKAIPLHKRIAIALYALGTSAEYRTVTKLFGVGRTTVGAILLSFCEAVTAVYGDIFKQFYPASNSKIKENVNAFLKLGFPQCYGAVDGCHIEVKPPKEEASDYINYKRFYSVILFAAVDYRCRFMYIDVGTPGRLNDSSIWEGSNLKLHHMQNERFSRNSINFTGVDIPVMLIGDSAFKLSEYIMKPYGFSTNQPEEEVIYNKKLSKCRRLVENAFGHLKARFRRLGKGLEVRISNVNTIVRTCCILHNILNECNDHINQTWLDSIEDFEIPPARHTRTQRSDNQALSPGSIIRNAIKAYLGRFDAGRAASDDEGLVARDLGVEAPDEFLGETPGEGSAVVGTEQRTEEDSSLILGDEGEEGISNGSIYYF